MSEEELGRFLDIPIELSVELDRRVMRVRDILNLRVGSVVTMNRSAGDNMSLLFHGVLVGYGEIVVIEDAIGIRITDLASE
jgi:flagellar motor switch protein FliN/FliY